MSIEAIKRARQIYKDYAETNSAIDLGNLYWALGAALQAIADQEKAEPVAWMYQHEETGRTAFIASCERKDGWKPSSPRMKPIGPLFTHPARVALAKAGETR